MTEKNDAMTALEAAEFLGAHVETVRRMARKGKIPAYKIGKDWRFRRESLLRWMDPHRGNSGPCVLVIDDEKGFREVIRKVLEKENYMVLSASNGIEGLAQLAGTKVDLVLLDLRMPGMSGPEFMRALSESGRTVPVIIVTGFPDSDLVSETIQYGPITLLSKPVERTQLLQAVKNVVRMAN